MKVLGVFSVIFGILLFVGSLLGFMSAADQADVKLFLLAIGNLIGSLATVYFTVLTFSPANRPVKMVSAKDILDAPDPVTEKKTFSFPLPLKITGIVSFIAGAAYTILGGYIIYQIASQTGLHIFSLSIFETVFLMYFELSALMLLLYSTKKLFFSVS